MEKTKQIKLKALDGSDITFTLNTLVSEWDAEQIDAIYEGSYISEEVQDPKDANKTITKIKVDPNKSISLSRTRSEKLIELFVKTWDSAETLNPETIKKTLARGEYEKLMKELNAIFDPSILDDKKKDSSQENSLTHSTLPSVEASNNGNHTSQKSS